MTTSFKKSGSWFNCKEGLLHLVSEDISRWYCPVEILRQKLVQRNPPSSTYSRWPTWFDQRIKSIRLSRGQKCAQSELDIWHMETVEYGGRCQYKRLDTARPTRFIHCAHCSAVVHTETPAEPYVHEEFASKPYIHVEPLVIPRHPRRALRPRGHPCGVLRAHRARVENVVCWVISGPVICRNGFAHLDIFKLLKRFRWVWDFCLKCTWLFKLKLVLYLLYF